MHPRLNTRSLKHLLLHQQIKVFIVLALLGCMLIYIQSNRAINQIQQQSIQGDIQTIKNSIQNRLQTWQKELLKLSLNPIMINSLKHDPKTLNTELITLISTIDYSVALFNNRLNPVYANIATEDKHKQIRLYISEIIRQIQLESQFKLYRDENKYILRIYQPIIEYGLISGVIVAEYPLNIFDRIPSNTENKPRWIGLSQPNGVEPIWPSQDQSWQHYQQSLDPLNFTLHYAVASKPLQMQRYMVFYQISAGLLVVLSFVFVLSYLSAKQRFIPPYRGLIKQQRQLTSENKRLKYRLLEAEKLAQVAQLANDSIVITDAKGKARWVNQAAVDLTGYQSHELIGRRPGDLLHGPDTSASTRHKIGVAIRQQRSIRTEILNYTRNKVAYWVDINITPVFDNQGKIESFIGIKRNSTKQHQLQLSLKKALEHAQAASIAKTRFLANISHEIRTPMNGILGMAQILKTTELQDEQINYLDNLQSSGQHLMGLLNDILDYSKAETDGIRFNPEHFTINTLIKNVHSTYRSLAHQKGIHFLFNDHIPAETWLFSDKDKINQILLNLITNAIKFTLSGFVKVTLSSEIDQAITTLTISVEDSGIGIAPKNQNTIFAPFTQAETSTTRRFGGTGLGLAVVQQITQAMGGEITLDSQLEQGSTFTITLPIPTGEAQSLKKVTPISRFHTNPVKALIVEDDQTNALILETFLVKRGFECLCVENGKLAIEATEQGFYPLIMMDNHMPELDGIEATRIIRQQATNEALIIGCTADVHTSSHEQMLHAGVNIVLSKPLEESELDKVLHEHVSHFNHWTKDQSQQSNEANTTLTVKDSPQLFHLQPTKTQTPDTLDKMPSSIPNLEAPSNPDSIDLTRLSERLGGDTQLLSEFLSLFIQEQKETNNRLSTAIANQDSKSIMLISHSIKGVAANMGALQLRTAALNVEKKSRTNKLPSQEEKERLMTQLNKAVNDAVKIRDTLLSEHD